MDFVRVITLICSWEVSSLHLMYTTVTHDKKRARSQGLNYILWKYVRMIPSPLTTEPCTIRVFVKIFMDKCILEEYSKTYFKGRSGY